MVNHATTLRAAAARVRTGWVQGSYDDFNGHVCAAGAIGYSVDSAAVAAAFQLQQLGQHMPVATWMALADTQAVLDTVKRVLKIDSVQNWNDAQGQTQEGVAVGLEYVALIWEQEQALPPCAACKAGGGHHEMRYAYAQRFVLQDTAIVMVDSPVRQTTWVPCRVCHGSGRDARAAGRDTTRPGANALPSSRPAAESTLRYNINADLVTA